jgi:hypothetical protein
MKKNKQCLFFDYNFSFWGWVWMGRRVRKFKTAPDLKLTDINDTFKFSDYRGKSLSQLLSTMVSSLSDKFLI